MEDDFFSDSLLSVATGLQELDMLPVSIAPTLVNGAGGGKSLIVKFDLLTCSDTWRTLRTIESSA